MGPDPVTGHGGFQLGHVPSTKWLFDIFFVENDESSEMWVVRIFSSKKSSGAFWAEKHCVGLFPKAKTL